MKKNILLIFLISAIQTVYGDNKTVNGKSIWSSCQLLDHTINHFMQSKAYGLKAVESVYLELSKAPKCDDASYAEGITEIIEKSLIKSFSKIIKWGSKDQKKSSFILTHIDATANWNDLDKIVILGNKTCPSLKIQLCEQVREQAQKASVEAKSVAR